MHDGEPAPVPIGPDAPILGVMSTMRAVRRLKPDPIPAETLELLITAASWAPSSSNQQAFHYVVVTDRAQMARIAEIWQAAADFYFATAGAEAPDTSDPAAWDRARGCRMATRSPRRDAGGDHRLLRRRGRAAVGRPQLPAAPGRPRATGSAAGVGGPPDRVFADRPVARTGVDRSPRTVRHTYAGP